MRGERPGHHTLQAISAQLMRRILVDAARARGSRKRGGAAVHVALDASAVVSPERDGDLLALDEALTRLAAVDARKAQVVELRYFGGLSVGETADALQVSAETVMRDWKVAKLWLLRELKRGLSDPSAARFWTACARGTRRCGAKSSR